MNGFSLAPTAPLGLEMFVGGLMLVVLFMGLFRPKTPTRATGWVTLIGLLALIGVSFAVKPGETVAIVGPSGAGKTTIFALAQRFFDPQKGTVSVDGVDVKKAVPQEVRERIAVVPPGVDHERFHPGTAAERRATRDSLGLGDRPVLLFAGRIQPLKGADLAVRALAALGEPEGEAIRFGLLGIKNVGASAAESIVAARESAEQAASLQELCERIVITVPSMLAMTFI